MSNVSATVTASVGWSSHADARQAGSEAAQRALAELSVVTPNLGMVFGSSWFEQPSLLAGVRSVLSDIPVIGGSTAGEIVPEGPVSHSCVVLLIASEAFACSVGKGEAVDQNPRAAGQQAAYAAMREFPGHARVGFLLFGDGLVTSYADVVRGIQEVVGTSSLIVGGMAGDDLRFTTTYQYFNDQVLTRSVVGALIGGHVRVGVGMEHGFAPISKPRHITRARANILLELDHRPAASVYEEYFGAELVHRMQQEGLTREGIAYPLGIRCEGTDQWLLRNVVSFHHDGSLSCSGEMLEGSWLQLMMGSRELVLDAAWHATQQAIQPLNQIACLLVFDSVARRTLLGQEHAAMEIARIRQAVGGAVPIAGCYTYGEQAPLGMTSVYGRTAVQTGSVLVIALGT